MEYVGPREADAEDDSPRRPLKEGAGKRRLPRLSDGLAHRSHPDHNLTL